LIKDSGPEVKLDTKEQFPTKRKRDDKKEEEEGGKVGKKINILVGDRKCTGGHRLQLDCGRLQPEIFFCHPRGLFFFFFSLLFKLRGCNQACLFSLQRTEYASIIVSHRKGKHAQGGDI